MPILVGMHTVHITARGDPIALLNSSFFEWNSMLISLGDHVRSLGTDDQVCTISPDGRYVLVAVPRELTWLPILRKPPPWVDPMTARRVRWEREGGTHVAREEAPKAKSYANTMCRL